MARANFNLQDFRSAVFKDSLARTNRFEVFIARPPAALSSTRPSNVSLYCEQASLPPLNIFTKAFKIFGPTYQRPFTAEYGGEGISVTFHVDRNMSIKTYFDEWMQKIVDPVTGTVGYQEEYITNIRIRQLDEAENITYEIDLLEAFPRSMNLMELNNAATNQTHRLNILFGYRYWRNVRTTQVTPTDISRGITNPQVPVIDTRLTNEQANAARRQFAAVDPRRVDL